MSRTVYHSCFLAATLLASASISPTAMAEDGKVYPGISCQKSLGTGSYGGGEVRNDSNSGSLTVECPIVRDVVYGSIQDAQVRAYKATSSAFWCTLHARSFWGNAGFQQFRSASSGTGYRTMNFSGLSDYNDGHYYIWCAIPPSTSSTKSRVIGYRLDEQ